LKAIAFVEKITKSKKDKAKEAKKKYFMLTWMELVGENKWSEKSEFKKKGFQKSDMPLILKEYEKNVQMLELMYAIGKKTKADVIDYVRVMLASIKKASPEKLCFRKTIKALSSYKALTRETDKDVPLEERKGIPIHVRAMLYSRRNLNESFSPGDKLKFIYVNKVPDGLPDTNVVAFNDESVLEHFGIDYTRQIDSFTKSLANLLSIIDINMKTDIRRTNKDIFTNLS
jgi:hypothetical protein